MSRKKTAAQQPVGRRRSERSLRRAPRNAEASGGGRPGVPGEARAGAHLAGPAPSGRLPLRAERLGRAGTPGFPGGAVRTAPRSARLALNPVAPLVWEKDTCRKCHWELFFPRSARVYRIWVSGLHNSVGFGERGNRCPARPSARVAASGDVVLGPRSPRARRLAWEGGDARLRWPSLRERRRRLSPCRCHLGPLPTGPLCLLIPGRRKPAGGT